VSWPVAIQALVTGLATGAAYGLIALGFTLVHRLTGVLALAHGDIVTGGVFVAVLAVIGTMPVATPLGAGRALVLVAVALLAGAALSAAVYAIAVRPFRGDAIAWVAAGLAAGLLVRQLLGLPFAQQAYGLCAGVVVERALAVTGAGAVMRAVSDDTGAAALLGVPTERVVLAAFLIAGGLAGLAGVLIAPQAPIGLEDGVLLGLKGMTAALLGRLGSLRLAIAGGLVLGVLEGFILASSTLGARWANVFVVALLAVLAATRPRGLLA
jgi:branched-chain amino acid transport system permease protein